MGNLCNQLQRKKSSTSVERNNNLAKTLNVFDLTALGIGSTLGVGIYVLPGSITKSVAGPAAIISFFIAAVTSAFSGLCYAEFGARTPTSGSAYTYCYITFGEFVAFIMGWNLITEYVIGAASVARALSSYIDTFFNNTIQNVLSQATSVNIPFCAQYIDFFAFFICIMFSVALSFGLRKSVILNNALTSMNIGIVAVFVFLGITKINFKNWNLYPFEVPKGYGTGGFFPYGLNGIIKGAGPCFYGFIGFDSIATTGAEVKNAEKSLPIAILLSLCVIYLVYFSAVAVLTLIVPYYLEDESSPLGFALGFIGYSWAMWIISIGCVIGLYASMFGAFFPVSRILYTMADDGLMFNIFGKVNKKYNTPVAGTIISGLITGLIAAVFDVQQLINLNSIGTLLTYTTVSICVVVLRYSDNVESDVTECTTLILDEKVQTFIKQVQIVVYEKARSVCPGVSINIIGFSVFSLILCVALNNEFSYKYYFCIIITIIMILLILSIQMHPESKIHLNFKMPLVPLIPAISIFLNVYLMTTFDCLTCVRFVIWLFFGFCIYFTYGICNSRLHLERNYYDDIDK